MSDAAPSGAELKKLYNDRYAGQYMAQDGYSLWSRQDLGRRRVADTLRQVPIAPAEILDYGCGVGGWIGLIAGTFPGARISGIDISETAIGKAADQYPAGRFCAFDGARAPFPDESFDLIFSYHVLEHVRDIETSIADIARLLRRGGCACIIFPCGNENSFQERIMRLMAGGKERSADGRTVFFFEIPDGHLRRMTSRETVELFARHGVGLVRDYYSGQFFGSIDWLSRASGPHYINQFFGGRAPVNVAARLGLRAMRRAFLMLNKLVRLKSLDLSRPRNPLKQLAVRAARAAALVTDKTIMLASLFEWRYLKRRRNGTVQYLVLRKGAP